ncbi:MAG TPA: tetratricopeptide repeat protein [Nitrospirota bacterium]|nr:tetratricopeptide repeat protein [Nitrospirota bacterium]
MTKDSSEIVKLTERISKDPKSKLFVPLAEEYKKIGDIEMAIHVLSEGLKINPGYVTARSFLGRLLLEQGNFAAAQAEFEEVVKAIPDNLLAHRKLGDLNLLQKRHEEALKHYKIVRTLNPGDAEIASVISNIEAGIAERAKVVQQKPATSPGQPTASHFQSLNLSADTSPPLSTPSSAETAAEESALGDSSERAPDVSPLPEGTGLAVEKPVAALLDESLQLNQRISGMAQQPAAPVLDREDAEEVFVVEPLEDDNVPVSDSESSNVDFFSEKVFETNPLEEQTDAIPASSHPAFEEQVFSEKKTEQKGIPDSNALIGKESEPVIPDEERSLEQTERDDFTTDTLAELYIAQGFFEKAIDIYQRMLTDNPNSRGLKDKLERVRAMAVPASEVELPQATIEKTVPESTAKAVLFAEPNEYVSPAEDQAKDVLINSEPYVTPQNDLTLAPEIDKKTELEIFGEPQEYRQMHEAEEWTGHPPGGSSFDEIFMPPQEETSKPIPQHTEFEPTEYIPPTADQLPTKEEEARSTPKSDTLTQKATIDRLEQWLSNIKKEK